MKKTILLATALGAGIAANANDNKLYLSSIECTNYDSTYSSDFTFKSLFQYDDNDNIIQIDINSHRSKKLNENMYLPEYVTFKFEYDGNVLKTAKYSDSDGKTLEGIITTTATADGKIIEIIVSGSDPAYEKVFKTEYNSKGELVRYEASEDENDDNIYFRNYNNILYSYNVHDRGDKVDIPVIEIPGSGCCSWWLQYGNDEELEKYYYSDSTVNTPVSNSLEISYCEANDSGEDTFIVAPKPIQFIYDTLFEDIYKSSMYAHTLFIPECIAQILCNQKKRIINTINEHYAEGITSCSFKLKYQAERPTASVETFVADEDAEPVYYNIQGMPVSNPAEGEIYIVRRGNKASKEIYRR